MYVVVYSDSYQWYYYFYYSKQSLKCCVKAVFMCVNLNCRHDYFQRKMTEKKQQMAEKAQMKMQWVMY